jgi:protein-tyrosine phosphatase
MKVLFVCEGNINRSQMAEAFLHDLRPDIEIKSAGTRVTPEKDGQKVRDVSSGRGIAAMKEVGIDTAEKIVNLLTPEMVEWADRVVLLGPTPGGPLPEFLADSDKLEMWAIPDPGYGHIPHTSARDTIREELMNFVQTLPKG